jgi:hypothetical protein
VVEPADIDAARGKALRLVLERGRQFRRRFVPLGLVVDLHVVPVRRGEGVGGPVAQIALGPPLAVTGPLDDADAVLQGLGARCPVGEVAHASDPRLGQLQRVALVIVPPAQIDRLAAPPALGHADDVEEEAQGGFGLRGQELHVAQVREIEGADGGLHCESTSGSSWPARSIACGGALQHHAKPPLQHGAELGYQCSRGAEPQRFRNCRGGEPAEEDPCRRLACSALL